MKECKVDLLNWNKGIKANARKQIKDLKLEIEKIIWGGGGSLT